MNTGIVFDEGGKKQKQFFRNMTREQFDKQLKEEKTRPVSQLLLDLCRKAADIYKKSGTPTGAVRCLSRLIAHGAAEEVDYENLAEIFAGLRNSILPEYIRTLAG